MFHKSGMVQLQFGKQVKGLHVCRAQRQLHRKRLQHKDRSPQEVCQESGSQQIIVVGLRLNDQVTNGAAERIPRSAAESS